MTFFQNGRISRVLNSDTICVDEEDVDDVQDGGYNAEVPQSRACPTIKAVHGDLTNFTVLLCEQWEL